MPRHQRKLDPYQTKEKFFELFELMKIAVYPKGLSDKDFKKLLFAVQYFERHPSKNSKTGRRGRFDESFLLNSSLKLKAALQNETGGRISFLRFVSTYLPIIDYPGDLQTALDKFKINLEEAKILARINRQSLGAADKREPFKIRKEMIDSHLKRQGTQADLRNRVLKRLNITPKKQAHQVILRDYEINKLLESNELDSGHILWEQIKSLFFLMREVDPFQLNDETTGEILNHLQSLKSKLLQFRRTEV